MKDRRFNLLRAIRDRKPFSKANSLLAPLAQAALIEIKYKPGTWSAQDAYLTDWGAVVLADEEKRRTTKPNPPVPQEVKDAIKNGCDNERELVGYIKTYLLTQDDKDVLAHLGLSIEDCLNGRFHGSDQTGAVLATFDGWNAIMGFEAFKF